MGVEWIRVAEDRDKLGGGAGVVVGTIKNLKAA